MKLFEIRRIISDSWDDHWNVIREGPIYSYSLGTINELATVAGYHSARAVLLDDLDISIEYGMPSDPFDTRSNWTESWSSFPDPKISGEYCDVFYRGALVDRTHLASVDGGRATLPLPQRKDDEWITMDWPYQVARLIDGLNGGHDFADYFKRSGIRRWPA